MKIGVSTVPCGSSKRPNRALDSESVLSNVNGTGVIEKENEK
jgi:hypothetical protein